MTTVNTVKEIRRINLTHFLQLFNDILSKEDIRIIRNTDNVHTNVPSLTPMDNVEGKPKFYLLDILIDFAFQYTGPESQQYSFFQKVKSALFDSIKEDTPRIKTEFITLRLEAELAEHVMNTFTDGKIIMYLSESSKRYAVKVELVGPELFQRNAEGVTYASLISEMFERVLVGGNSLLKKTALETEQSKYSQPSTHQG